MSESIPAYEIFFGYFDSVSLDKNAVLLESVTGLGAANDRMKELATETPGPYFLFDVRTHRILGSIDTSTKSKARVENNSEVA